MFAVISMMKKTVTRNQALRRVRAGKMYQKIGVALNVVSVKVIFYSWIKAISWKNHFVHEKHETCPERSRREHEKFQRDTKL